MKKYIAIMMCLIAGGVDARTALSSAAKSRAAGHISGRVESILKDLRLSAQERHEALSIEYNNVKTMGLESHDPTLVAKIEAHLGLASQKVERLVEDEKRFEARAKVAAKQEREKEAAVAGPRRQKGKRLDRAARKAEEAGDDEAALGGEDVAPLNTAFLSYAKGVIDAASGYMNRYTVVGAPTISDQRHHSLEALISKADEQEDTRLKQVQMVHTKVQSLVRDNKTVKEFVKTFVEHIREKYAAETEGMENEIAFRVLEVMLYAPAGTTIGEYVGSFDETYNEYVTEEFRATPALLAGAASAWPDQILASKQAQIEVMFLLSFAMEKVKRAVKKEPLLQQVKEGLSKQTAALADRLDAAGVSLSDEERALPLSVAMKCAQYLEKEAPRYNEMKPEDQQNIAAIAGLVQQIQQTGADYDSVTSEMADARGQERVQEDLAALPEEQQTVIANNSSIDDDEFTAMMMGDFEDEQKPSLGKKIVIGALAAAVVSGVAYKVMNK